MSEFAEEEVLVKLPYLVTVTDNRDVLAAIVIVFAIRALSIPKVLTEPLASDLRSQYFATDHQREHHEMTAQLPLETVS